MKKIPLKNEQERQEVFRKLKQGVKYSEIMEDYDIGKSSLSEYNKKIRLGIIKVDEESTEPNRTETEPKKKAEPKKILPAQAKKKLDQVPVSIQFNKFLTDLEFENFSKAVDLIYNSNFKRYKTGKASGMLKALTDIKKTKDIIGVRLGYGKS